MKISQRKSISDRLEKYCILSDSDDFVEVTEWTNQEGYDISFLGDDSEKSISLTHGEIEAISYLTKTLEYKSREEEEE